MFVTLFLSLLRIIFSYMHRLDSVCFSMIGRFTRHLSPLRKLAYAKYRDFIENLHWKNFDNFLTFAQNIDCGYTLEPPCRGGSNEYPQSIFWTKNKKNRYTPAYPSFSIKQWGIMGYTLHGHDIVMHFSHLFLTLFFLDPP